MVTVVCSAIAAIICALTSSDAASGRQAPPVFHAEVSLVHLDAEATDTNGHIITGLSKADFRVFDEDVEQPLIAVAGEDQPLDVILLFDTSGSMHSVSTKVAAAGHDAFSSLRAGDRVAVMAFDTDTRLLTPLTDDFTLVEESLAFLSKDSHIGAAREFRMLSTMQVPGSFDRTTMTNADELSWWSLTISADRRRTNRRSSNIFGKRTLC